MKDITLYYAPDNASLIVRIVLEELNCRYQSVLVDRRFNEQRSEHFLKLNPSGLIPVCVIDNVVITETAAIVLHLAESEGSSLVPVSDNTQRATFLRFLFFLSNTLHADLRQLFYAEKYVGDDVKKQADYRQRVRTRIAGHLRLLETDYALTSQPYFFGSQLTILDIYLAVCLRWLQLYPLIDRGWFEWSDYPALYTMTEALQQRRAVVSACEVDGISGAFFTSAEDANPSNGSAL